MERGLKRLIARSLGRLGLLPAVSDAYYFLRQRPGGPQGDDSDLPSPALRCSSAGTIDSEWFLRSGELAQQALDQAIAQFASFETPEAVLDFGCGCGRVLRHAPRDTSTRYVGVDWNRRAIKWCRRNLPFAEFQLGSLMPPLPEVGQLDLIYAFSVFTHLTVPAQKGWAESLSAHLSPRGLLVLSTHGDALVEQLTAEELETYRAGRIVVREPDAAGTNACAAYHPGNSIESVLPGDLRMLGYVERGALGNPPQDLWVFGRR
ncbi:MAG: class I SAM-dependent methyltransferase [Thermoanaerobaculia bacterium]|nr:class I SAM-dependent methyltransferase [Thermoanaerobaculia bacterium]